MDFKTVTLKKGANYESLFSIYKYNLQRTLSILDYCLEHNIKAYRVSSALFSTYGSFRLCFYG